MKKGFLLSLAVYAITTFLISCNQTGNMVTEVNHNETTPTDSIAQQLQLLDSLNNSGNLIHLDIYNIGKIKSISFSVHALEVEGKAIQYINLRKDVGNEYYYNWEDARILPNECQYLLTAIQTIKENSERATNHEERYAYITKDDIRIFSVNNGGGNKWKIALSIDYRKDRSEITLTEEELDTFVSLINQGLAKIAEIM